MQKLWMIAAVMLVSLLTVPMALQAQEELSREEAREWKQRAREYRRNPAALKALTESAQDCENRTSGLVTENNQLKASLANKDVLLSNYEAQIADLNQRLLAAQSAGPATQPSQPSQPTGPLPTDEVLMGVVFRVQLGAFQQTQMEDELITNPNLAVEESNGVQKIVVGQFRRYANAKALRDRLRQMGASDAWIVCYNDGQRISVEEALRLSGQQ
jgi:hypothetical protein